MQHALHDARILYVSATGATTVQNLAYAARLGLWGTGDFPFATRADFVAAMEKGGVAAMEVLARDLKALGLYAARSLSFEGIEYEIVEHTLTQEQIRIYDAYADAFQIIHRNLHEALKAANITGESGATYNRNAKAAARSAFESNKQRFFNHLLTAMKCPTLIAAIARDLKAGHACVLQVVSTNEARLAEIPTSEWNDLALDQVLHRFGMTPSPRSPAAAAASSGAASGSASRRGRLPRISRKRAPSWTTTSASSSSPTPAAPGAAITRISTPKTSASASITCSSPAGGPMPQSRVSGARTAPTRSSRRCSVPSRPTSKAKSASCRRSRGVSTRSAPSPAASARPGGQGLFRADDNLESPYAKAALRQFYQLLHAGKIDGCPLTEFEEKTGLDLCDQDGSLREELPPITQFLNRVLALRIAMQNRLFAAFEQLLEARIEAAVAAGIFDVGVETLTAESFRVAATATPTPAATACCARTATGHCHWLRPLPCAETAAACWSIIRRIAPPCKCTPQA